MSYCFDLETYTDHRGALTVIQEGLDITFPIRRVFWLYGCIACNSLNNFRGRHSHKKCKMVLVCLHGTVIVNQRVANNVDRTSEYQLDRPNLALYLEPEAWREIKMTDDSVVLVLCSEPFDEDDYVRAVR